MTATVLVSFRVVALVRLSLVIRVRPLRRLPQEVAFNNARSVSRPTPNYFRYPVGTLAVTRSRDFHTYNSNQATQLNVDAGQMPRVRVSVTESRVRQRPPHGQIAIAI